MATDQLSRTFAALADPTRRSMLALLADRERTVGELVEPFDCWPSLTMKMSASSALMMMH